MQKLELAHTTLNEQDALRLLEDQRISRGGRTMDPKAQIVGEFVKSIRVPGYFPPLPELRKQLRTMVALMDEPAPALARIEDIGIPGPAGALPARVYEHTRRDGAPRPVVAYFHGGGWVQGDLETHHGLCARLALRSGALVVAVDYRLAPEHPFPAAVEDCLAASRWLRSHGGEIGADPTRIAVAGDSAGGNLAAVVSQRLVAAGEAPPTAQALIYPAVDFVLDTPSHHDLEDAHIIPRDRILWYADQYLPPGIDRLDPRASPLRARDLAGQPPTLVITAGFDPLRDEGHAYAEALRAAKVDVVDHEYPGQIHAFVSLTKAIPQGLTATEEVADFLGERLFGPSPPPQTIAIRRSPAGARARPSSPRGGAGSP
jgi:acetyl esterase/lipase